MNELNKFDKLKVQLIAVEQLRALKKFYKYKELEDALGIPASILARYIKGEMIPSYERALEIMNKVYKANFINKVLKLKLIVDRHGFLNIREVLSDLSIVKLLAYQIITELTNFEFNKVISMDIDSIAIASLVASHSNSNLVLVSKDKTLGLEKLIEEIYRTDSPPFLMTLYVPEATVSKGDKAVIIGSVLRTGRTLEALLRLLRRVEVNVERIFILVSIGSTWRHRLSNISNRIIIFTSYDEFSE